jgi:hypothetical protein
MQKVNFIFHCAFVMHVKCMVVCGCVAGRIHRTPCAARHRNRGSFVTLSLTDMSQSATTRHAQNGMTLATNAHNAQRASKIHGINDRSIAWFSPSHHDRVFSLEHGVWTKTIKYSNHATLHRRTHAERKEQPPSTWAQNSTFSQDTKFSVTVDSGCSFCFDSTRCVERIQCAQ